MDRTEGFLKLRWSLPLQRIVTRALTIIPARLGIHLLGENAVGQLIMLSQAILAIQLPFAIYPLIEATSNKHLMGDYASSKAVALLAWLVLIAISAANVWAVVTSASLG